MEKIKMETREIAPGYYTEMPKGAHFSPTAHFPWDEYVPFYSLGTVSSWTEDEEEEYIDQYNQAACSMEDYIKVLLDDDWYSMAYHPHSGEWTYLPQAIGWEKGISSEEFLKEFLREEEYSNYEIKAIQNALKGTRRFQ